MKRFYAWQVRCSRRSSHVVLRLAATWTHCGVEVAFWFWFYRHYGDGATQFWINLWALVLAGIILLAERSQEERGDAPPRRG